MPKMPKLVFVDCETTGLDENFQEIVEIAIVSEEGEVLLHTKVKPQHLEEALAKDPDGTKKALEINGYNELDWAQAPTWVEVSPRVRERLTDVVIAGHNPGFDMRFINAWLKRTEVGNGGVGYHFIDTATLVHEQLKVHPPHLKTACTILGISNEGGHNALVDSRRAREVYFRLLRASWFHRLWWRVLRALRV